MSTGITPNQLTLGIETDNNQAVILRAPVTEFGFGADLELFSGNGTADNDAGKILLTGGTGGSGDSDGGDVGLVGGNATVGDGGDIFLTSGTGGEGHRSGNVHITANDAENTLTDGDGGNIQIFAGAKRGAGTPGDLMLFVGGGNILMLGIPTSDPAVAGAVYSNAGTLKISAG